MTTITPSATWTLEELESTRVPLVLKALEWALSAATHHAPRLEVRDGDAYCPACDEYVYRSAQIGAVVISQEVYGADVDGDTGALSFDAEDATPYALTQPAMLHFPSGARAPHMIRPAEGAGEVTAW